MNPYQAFLMIEAIKNYLKKTIDSEYCGVLHLNNRITLDAWHDKDDDYTGIIAMFTDGDNVINSDLGQFYCVRRVRDDSDVAMVEIVGRNGQIAIHDYFEPILDTSMTKEE